MTRFAHLTRQERLACIAFQLEQWELPRPNIGDELGESTEAVLFSLLVKIKDLEDKMKEHKL